MTDRTIWSKEERDAVIAEVQKLKGEQHPKAEQPKLEQVVKRVLGLVRHSYDKDESGQWSKSIESKTVEVDETGVRRWLQDEVLHRLDGPAVVRPDGREEWYRNGNLHRDDGPAMVIGGNEFWYRHGRLHRWDGPAVVRVDGTSEWWLNGTRIGDPTMMNEQDVDAMRDELEELEDRAAALRDRLQFLEHLREKGEAHAQIAGDRALEVLADLARIPDLTIFVQHAQLSRMLRGFPSPNSGDSLTITWKTGKTT